jgi:hypothetical protein
VLYLPGLKKILLAISVMEGRGFVVMFKKGQVLVHQEGGSPDTRVALGVERAIYTG